MHKLKSFIARSVVAALACLSSLSHAHVKWFATNTDSRVPRSPWEVEGPSFWFLALLSLFTIGLFVALDRRWESWRAYNRLNKYLGTFSDRAIIILRVFTGASLLLTWQAGSMVAPELFIPSEAAGWFQFFMAILLLTAYSTPIAGAGLIGLYFYAMAHYGFFHLLDYVVYPAVGYFLLASSFKKIPQFFNSRVPALYIGLGFSLCWAALEKIFFAQWGLDVLAQRPELTMGLNPQFFLMACAFVELSLGYLLIIGVLQRPLALTVTLVFFTTTAVFGKVEVIGHTLLHGALLVFIVLGPGRYYPRPIEWHRQALLRAAFAMVNFIGVGVVLGYAYWKMASH